MKTLCLVLAFLWTLASVQSRIAQRMWTDCGNPSSPVRLTNLEISPNPVYLPGNLEFSISGYTNETLGSSSLHLSLVREGSWFNLYIPCIAKIGSCTYDDMCTLLDEMIDEDWLGITRDFGQDIKQMLINNGLNPGLCPQPPQVINIVRGGPLRLPTMPAILYWFSEGVYRVNVRVTDNQSGQELVCFNVRLRIRQNREDCSGWWGC